jgi:hypothetical protein
LDYARAGNLAIYSSDGLVNNSLVAPAVRADVKQYLKNIVGHYRESIAAASATSGIRQELDTELP